MGDEEWAVWALGPVRLVKELGGEVLDELGLGRLISLGVRFRVWAWLMR